MSSQLNETNLFIHTLEELDFYSYKLSSLDSNTFYDFTNLKRLSLRDNNISKIHSTTFQNLINLETELNSVSITLSSIAKPQMIKIENLISECENNVSVQ